MLTGHKKLKKRVNKKLLISKMGIGIVKKLLKQDKDTGNEFYYI